MRYIIFSILLLVFAGCGGSGSVNDNPPTSPQTSDSSNTPPQVPKI